MAALPYMQLYIADYLADTAHLNAAQHGAYLLLMMNYWQTGKPLRNSCERLANVARMSCEEWEKNRAVLEEFFTVTPEYWIHKRIDQDLIKVKEKSAKARSSAQQRHSERNANAMRTQCYTDTDTDTEEKKKEKIKKKKNEKIAQLTELEKAFEVFWTAYPNRVDKQDAKKAYLKLNPDPELQEKILFAIDAQIAEREIKSKYNVWTPDWKMPATWLNKKTWENEIAEESVIAKQPKMRGNYEKPKSKVDIHGEACAGAFAGLPSDFFDNLDTSEFAIGGTVERLD